MAAIDKTFTKDELMKDLEHYHAEDSLELEILHSSLWKRRHIITDLICKNDELQATINQKDQEIFLLKSWQEKFTDSRYDPECVAEELRDKVDRLQAIVDKQREALEFYGDTNNYKEGNTIRPYERHFPVLEDAGVIAIKALALTATDKENG